MFCFMCAAWREELCVVFVLLLAVSNSKSL